VALAPKLLVKALLKLTDGELVHPRVSVRAITVVPPGVASRSDDGATNLLVDLRFHSKQPVTTEWKDLDVKLQWKKDDDDDSVVKVAEFQRASSFSTDAYESQHLHPGLKSIDPVQASLLFAQCSLGDDGVLARLKGSVKQGDAKFAVRTPWKHVICVYG